MITDKLIQKFEPTVRRIAGRVYQDTGRAIAFNDLMQTGYVALIEAAQRYRQDRDCSLKTYLSIRIHGAMLDEARYQDATTRCVRRFQREKRQARRQLGITLNRKPSAQETAECMGLTLEKYRELNNRPVIHALPIPNEDDDDYEARFIPLCEDDPRENVEKGRKLEALRSCIAALPERQRHILSGILQETPYRILCQKYGLTHARITQLKNEAIQKVTRRMERLG